MANVLRPMLGKGKFFDDAKLPQRSVRNPRDFAMVKKPKYDADLSIVKPLRTIVGKKRKGVGS